MGGKNSIINKPLGTGKHSVSRNPLNISPLHSGSIGGGRSIWGDKTLSENPAAAIGAVPAAIFGGKKDKAMSSMSMGDVEGFMEKGQAKGEELTGTTSAQAGQGRAEVRDRLGDILKGESAGANALKQDQAQSQKALKAQQALAGGGQSNAGQLAALERQGQRDTAEFVSKEKRQALSDLSKEWRGAGGDIMKSSGQYGSILVGGQPAAQPASSNGLLSNIFGGLF